MREVIVSLYGGLGNQLFQYATGLALAAHHNASLVLDLSWFKSVQHRQALTNRAYALTPFAIDAKTASFKHPHRYIKSLSKKTSWATSNNIGVPFFYEKQYNFNHALSNIALPVHLDGYWQSYRYFESIRAELISQLATPKQLNNANKTIYQQIKQSQSVAVHIRRGDYVTNANAANYHGICSINYYQTAIEQMSAKYPDAEYFFFSDDLPLVKANFNFKQAHTFVDVNDGDTAYMDLWLMAACQHFIIANSSFSWWGAWLGQYADKQVIAPKQWFKKTGIDTRDLIPDKWLRL